MHSEPMIEKLNQKQIDIGILATPLEESYLREIPVFYEPFLVYADLQNEIYRQVVFTAYSPKLRGRKRNGCRWLEHLYSDF